MPTTLRATRREELAAPAEVVLRVVQDIASIEVTEVKADRVEVHPESPTSGTYAVTGRFAGAHWRSRFRYRLHAAGFHSAKVDGETPRGWGISGGFLVAPAGDGRCVVVHYEDYDLPAFLVPLKPLVGAYLRWSMAVELRRLAALVGAATPAA